MGNALRKRKEDPVALQKLDAILHSINCVNLAKNALIFFFKEGVSPKEITGFFRSFAVEIRDGTKIKMLSEPIVLMTPREITARNQLIVPLPLTLPRIREGDIVRIHLLGRQGKDFVL